MLTKSTMRKKVNNFLGTKMRLNFLKSKTIFLIGIFMIFIIAGWLRISLASINQFANDQHFMVIKIISDQHIIPDRDTPKCKQCYHPKLYYLSAFSLIKIISSQYHSRTNIQQVHIAQQLNVCFGLLTLVIVFLFLLKLQFSRPVILATFSLIALNPRFIAINIQVTNDSLIILLSALTMYFLYLFLHKGSLLVAATVILFSTLALLSKSSGVVLFLGVLFILVIFLIGKFKEDKYRKKYILVILVFLVINTVGGGVFGPYYDNYKATGDFFAINRKKSPPAKLFKKTYIKNKVGVTSIADSYLTFRFLNLLKHPFIDRSGVVRESALNQTSLWTELYARFNFIQHEAHPRQWKNKKGKSFRLGRLAYLFAIIPLAVFILGVFVTFRRFYLDYHKYKLKVFMYNLNWIFLFFFFLFVLALIKFTLDYRSFVSMKIIYIFPAMLPGIIIFANGLTYFFQKILNFKYRWLFLGSIIIPMVILLGIYIMDSLLLLETLQNIKY